MAKQTQQPRRDHGRQARRQLDSINNVLTGAPRQTQRQTKGRLDLPRNDGAKIQKSRTQRKSPERRDHGKAHPKKQAELLSSTTSSMSQHRDKTSPPPTSKPVTGKRARSETEDTQQPAKKARTEQGNAQSPLPQEVNTACVTKAPVSRMSDAERMAARIKRFAQPITPIGASKNLQKKATNTYNTKAENGATKNVNEDSPKKTNINSEVSSAKTSLDPVTTVPKTLPAAEESVQRTENTTKTGNESQDTPSSNVERDNKKKSDRHALDQPDEQPLTEGQGDEQPSMPTPVSMQSTPANTLTPASEKSTSSNSKRARSESDDSTENSSKKQRLESGGRRLPDVTQSHAESKSTKEEILETPTHKPRKLIRGVTRKQPRVYKPQQFAPVEFNHEIDLTYFPYDDDSIPILHSNLVGHEDDGYFFFKQPDVFLRQNALELLRRKTFTNAELGREDVPRTGPSHLINDCDLYYRKEQIYVASERGLLLAADYLKLIGVPETQHVRFDGRKPAWAKHIEAMKQKRMIEGDFQPTKQEKAQGFIPLEDGLYVMLFERFSAFADDGELLDLGYGMVCGENVTGMFPYEYTADYVEHDVFGWKAVEAARAAKAMPVKKDSVKEIVKKEPVKEPVKETLKKEEPVKKKELVNEEKPVEKEAEKKELAKEPVEEEPVKEPVKQESVKKEQPKPAAPPSRWEVEDEVDWDDD